MSFRRHKGVDALSQHNGAPYKSQCTTDRSSLWQGALTRSLSSADVPLVMLGVMVEDVQAPRKCYEVAVLAPTKSN